MSTSTDEEVKFWLENALKSENLSNFTITRVGSAEKGDGYMGDIVFINVSTRTRTYNLCLKCSKQSARLRDNLPVKETFENEIHLYENILPSFIKFQKSKNVPQIFNSLPKYFGKFVHENLEVVVLQNMKANGFYLFDRMKPLTRQHLELVLQEYGKWHAISAAMREQEPKVFQNLVTEIINVWKIFAEKVDPKMFFGPPIEEVYEVLKGVLSASAVEKLKNFRKQIEYIVKELIHDCRHFSVVTHGDCWNNNFMFKEANGELKVAMLDWQTAKLCSPAADISYFIYACSSEEDLRDFDDLLKIYYSSFTSFSNLLGTDVEKIFPFSQFLKDFRLFGKYGVMMTILAIKVALTDKEEVPDFAETVETGFGNTFSFKNRNQDVLKERTLYIVEHAAKMDIL